MTRWKGSSVGAKLKIVIFSLLPALALLVGFEAFSRYEITRTFRVVNDSSGASRYEMRIGSFPWSVRSVTALNSMGFPDREFADLGAKGSCRHIVFAGDSFIFGDGVDGDKSFVSLLRARYESQAPQQCVRIFNISQRATTIEQQAARIRETLELLDPDLVIVGQYQNDLSDLTKPGFAAHGAPAGAQASAPTESWADHFRRTVPVFRATFLQFLTYRALDVMIERDMQYDLLARWSIFEDSTQRERLERLKTLYTGYYDDLVTELRSKQIAFGVLILPSKFDLLAKRSPEEAFFRALAERAQVPYITLLPALDSSRARNPYLMYDGHLNEHGNAVVAEAVGAWLFGPSAFPMLIGVHDTAAVALP